MREIKFRAWVKPLGVYWFCREFFTDYMYGFVTAESNGGGADENLKRHDFVLQQFTGFKDKNNKDIYEGDICFANGRREVIVFKDGMFGYNTTLGMHCILIPSLMEVIGNVFEQAWMLEAYNLKA